MFSPFSIQEIITEAVEEVITSEDSTSITVSNGEEVSFHHT